MGQIGSAAPALEDGGHSGTSELGQQDAVCIWSTSGLGHAHAGLILLYGRLRQGAETEGQLVAVGAGAGFSGR